MELARSSGGRQVNYRLTSYENKKHLHRLKYYEKKALTKQQNEVFQPYGGEANYYKNRLIEAGYLFKAKDV